MSEIDDIVRAVWTHAEAEFCALANRKRHVIDPVPWERVHESLKPLFRENIRKHGHPWRKPATQS